MADPSSTKGPPRKILLATDLSARCDRAMDRAAALAKEREAQLVAVHALEQPETFYRSDVEQRLPSWRRTHDPARIVLDQLRQDLFGAADDISAVVERGAAADVILAVAEKEGCDLVVTGLARDETLGRFGLGGTVDTVLRRSEIPVLIVKQRVRAPYRNIIVATDFSDASRAATETALAFFPEQDIPLFHAYHAPMARLTGNPAQYQQDYARIAETECAEFIERLAAPEPRRRGLRCIVEPGSPKELVSQFVRDMGVDLVVLGTQGRSALADALIGSTAKEIFSALPCDALVVRRRRRGQGAAAA